MQTHDQIDLEDANATAYDDLVAAIEASNGVLSLLLVVCDDPQLREATIQRYEAELQPAIRPYRVEIPRTEPSLRRVIAQKIEQEAYLQEGGRAVITVTGTEGLSFLTLGDEKSEQDTFLGFLQWTREALRTFRYPIVLWVTAQLLSKLSRKAPDFWSWRKDVFRFSSKKTGMVPSTQMEPLRPAFDFLGLQGVTEENSIPLEDLQRLITQTEARLGDNRNDKLLATLYERMGHIYASRINQGEAIQYPAELQTALDYFRKAADIQATLGLETDLASSLAWQGYLYKSQGRYSEAEPLYARSLSIYEQQLGPDHPDVANGLNYFASLYESQGRYSKAEPLYVRSLEIREKQLGKDHPDVANSLNNLAGLYKSQGRYSEAEPLYVRSLEISEQQLGKDHPSVAASLNNLAGLYDSQGRYSEAEPLYVRSLEISEQQLGKDHPDVANSLNNLAALYKSQGRYSEAESLFVECIRIVVKLSGQMGFQHPNLEPVVQNFYSFVGQVLQKGRQAELSEHPLTQSVLEQLQAEQR